MRIRAELRIVWGGRLCAVLGITLLVGIGAYADSVRKTAPAGKHRVAVLRAKEPTGQHKVAPALTTPAPQDGSRHVNAGSVCESYQIDDGTTETSVGFGVPGVIVWANRHTVQPAWETITAISTAFGSVLGGNEDLVGKQFSAGVWSDPNQDGDPSDGALVSWATDVVAAGVPDTDTFQTVDIDDVVLPLGDFFFVVAWMQGDSFPAPLDTSEAGGGRSWVNGTAGDVFDPDGWVDGGWADEDTVAEGIWLLRACTAGSATCGNDVREGFEECDGPDDANCALPDTCLEDCTCPIFGACCDPGGDIGGCDENQEQAACEGQAGGGNWIGEGTACYLCACESAENECLDGKSGGVGCSDFECCTTVCDITPECCEVEWDISCAGEAAEVCPFPPENDNCADSLPIFLGDTDYDTTDANTDGIAHGLDCALEGQTFQDIWYDHVATCDGILRVTTCPGLGGAASYDTHLVIYTGCDVADCPPGEEDFLGCNDDGPVDDCPGFQSFLEVPVVEGQCYKIRAGGFSDGDQGTGTLHLECNPPPDPTGACCLTALGENCDILTAAGCGKVGGDYLGDDEVCSFIEGEQVFEVTGLNLILLDNGGPMSDTITVEGDTVIFDVDVGLAITHSWVGDLRVTLEHNGTTVVLISQPGDPDDEGGAPYGCDLDNYDNIILDDQGTGGNIEDVCEFNLTSPPNYVPFELLAAFNGMSKGGDWTITAEDVESDGEDEGRFTGWSLHIEGAGQEISNCDAGGGCGDCPPDQGGTKGEVDPVDLAGLLGCWGPKTLPGCECFDADGKNGINPLDLATLLGSWGECPLP